MPCGILTGTLSAESNLSLPACRSITPILPPDTLNISPPPTTRHLLTTPLQRASSAFYGSKSPPKGSIAGLRIRGIGKSQPQLWDSEADAGIRSSRNTQEGLVIAPILSEVSKHLCR